MYEPLAYAPRDGTRFVGFIRGTITKRIMPVEAYWEKGLKEPRFIFDGWKTKELLDAWGLMPELNP